MKRFALALVVGSLVLPFGVACSREVSHTEQNKTTLTGQQQHTEETVKQNPDGSYTTEKSKSSY